MGSGNSVTEIRNIGTCRINLGGRDMGFTQGGVTVKITTDWHSVVVDKYGTVPLDDIDTGTNIEVTIPLVQASLDNYKSAFSTGSNTLTDRLTFGRQVGTSITKARLVLDPINESDGLVVYQAGCFDVDELGFNNEGERILNCHFKGYIDDDRAAGDKVFRIFGGMS